MRHDHLLLSEDESRKVIDEVNAWCRRTGTNYNKLVTAARVHVSTRHAVRFRRRRLMIETAAKLRAAMRANPHGIEKGEHKRRVLQVAYEKVARQRAKRRQNFPSSAPPQASEPCFRCGSRFCKEHGFERGAYA